MSCLWHLWWCNLSTDLQSSTSIQSAVTFLLRAAANLAYTSSIWCYLWLQHNIQVVVCPFQKTCKLQVKLMILCHFQSSATSLGCWNFCVLGKNILGDDCVGPSGLVSSWELTLWTHAERAPQHSSLLKASLLHTHTTLSHSTPPPPPW